MRLTKKYKNSFDVDDYYTNGKISSGICYIDDNKNFTNACIYKLGQLEDLMEKYGFENAEDLDNFLQSCIARIELENRKIPL